MASFSDFLKNYTERFARGDAAYPGGSPNPTGISGSRPQGSVPSQPTNNFTLQAPTAPLQTTQNTSGRPQGNITPPTNGGYTLQQPGSQQQGGMLSGFISDPDQRALAELKAKYAGQLTSPVEPGDPTLPADAQAAFDSQRNDLTLLAQQMLAAKEKSLGRLDVDKATALARTSRGRELGREQLAQALANRGILRSGINAAEQGKLEEGYANTVGDINSGALRQANDINSKYVQDSAQLADILSRLTGQEAGLLTEVGLANDEQYANDLANFNANFNDVKNLQGTPLETPIEGVTTLEGLQALVSDIFAKQGVKGSAETGESEEERYKRIAQEIVNGRSLDNVKSAVAGIAKRQGA